MTDNAWQLAEYSISELADGQSSVYLRWGYSILDSQAHPYSGWNIDDIALKDCSKMMRFRTVGKTSFSYAALSLRYILFISSLCGKSTNNYKLS